MKKGRLRIAGVLAGAAASLMVCTGTAHAWDSSGGKTGSGTVRDGRAVINLANPLSQTIACDYKLYPRSKYAQVTDAAGTYTTARGFYKGGQSEAGNRYLALARGKESRLGRPVASRTNIVVAPYTTRTVSWKPAGRAGDYVGLTFCSTGYSVSRTLGTTWRDFDSNVFLVEHNRPGIHGTWGSLGGTFGS